MRGFTIIGLVVALLIVALLALFLLKSTTVSTPESTESPLERARILECKMKLKAIRDELRIYNLEHGHFPRSLDEIRSDCRCPVTGVEYRYDPKTGQVWCPDHPGR
ncbi:hypothetical protein DRP53_02195 [candidate division WOR-3 bacterium]|uniref:Type II secretion system protein GspG C-terminal domain-containing protein n=1 Tax=candidate division WOR-3 bacterium TaxID=2052148 RepID=A0A660SMS0_UNCW3|nr:MAG: hypothetical protein DRP53_02195 [candidate division WOR-3 bacterium]